MTAVAKKKEVKIDKTSEEQEMLRAMAEETNVADSGFSMPPKLVINYQKGLVNIPVGTWVYGQKRDASGDIVETGMPLINPEVVILVVRSQYNYFDQSTNKGYRSPMFKQFGKNVTHYKQELIAQIRNKTKKSITEEDISSDQLVYGAVMIENEWRPCFIPTFKGSNFIVLRDYLKKFSDPKQPEPYFAYKTTLPTPVLKKKGATEYYLVENITRGERFSITEINEFYRQYKLLADAIDSGSAILTPTDEGHDAPMECESSTPTELIDDIRRRAVGCGFKDGAQVKDYIKTATGIIIHKNLSHEEHKRIIVAMEDYKNAFPEDVANEEIPF